MNQSRASDPGGSPAGGTASEQELPELVRFFRTEEAEWGHKGDYENWSPERAAIELIRSLRRAALAAGGTPADEDALEAARRLDAAAQAADEQLSPVTISTEGVRGIVRLLRSGAAPPEGYDMRTGLAQWKKNALHASGMVAAARDALQSGDTAGALAALGGAAPPEGEPTEAEVADFAFVLQTTPDVIFQNDVAVVARDILDRYRLGRLRPGAGAGQPIDAVYGLEEARIAMGRVSSRPISLEDARAFLEAYDAGAGQPRAHVTDAQFKAAAEQYNAAGAARHPGAGQPSEEER